MSKTPEEMAEEYIEDYDECEFARDAFLAGYQAAKDDDKAKVQELEANWKFCCEDKLRLLNELAAAERAKDQLADADKVMPEWISVNERLPEIGEHGYSEDVLLLSQVGRMEVSNIEKVKRMVTWRGIQLVIETGNGTPIEDYTHWMPLPEAPKEDK